MFWTSGDVSSGFRSQSGQPCLSFGDVHVTCSLRFTSSATPANLLAANMAAQLSLPHTCEALVGLETGSYHATAHSVRSGRPDALPTELSRLGSPPRTYAFSDLITAL